MLMMPKVEAGTGAILVRIVDGRRKSFAASRDSLLRILDGRKQQVVAPWVKGGAINVTGLPYHDNLDDRYTVFVHSKGYTDGAVFPVQLKERASVDANVMLLPEDGAFHFKKWADLKNTDARLMQLLTNGTDNAAQRYSDTLEKSPQELGALLTIATAVRDISLADSTSPLSFYWEVMWDRLAPDRFWAWVEEGLADKIQKLAELDAFAAEADPGHWHPGTADGKIGPSTRSWKQTRFDVTNVQLSFHEKNRAERTDSNGRKVQCVAVEPDIDYYKDLLAHGLLEVLPNKVTKGKTDPRMVYQLRWMAALQEGLPAFDPPCTIE
jgi:hypothetical protein